MINIINISPQYIVTQASYFYHSDKYLALTANIVIKITSHFDLQHRYLGIFLPVIVSPQFVDNSYLIIL